MNTFFPRIAKPAVALTGTLLLAGCASHPTAAPDPHAADAAAFAAPTKLTARLLDPLNIDLKWKDNATNEAGYFVEYSPDANNEYVIIEALPPNSTHFRHERLLPQTRFVYRVRPFFGPASNAAEFRTGKEGVQQELAVEETNAPAAGSEMNKSLRAMTTFASAAPAELTAQLIPPAGVKLKWRDRSSDEDGFLLEIKAEWSSAFKPSAFIDPNSTSLISYGFPFESTFQVRVRAFFYGQPSNLAEKTTGIDPTLGPGAWKKSE